MRNFIKKKRVIVAAGAVALLVAAGGAYAYFTTTGSGTSTATVGSTAAVTVNGTSATTLYPGTSSTVTFRVSNPSSGAQFVNVVHLASVTADSGHPTCAVVLNTDFSMPDVTVAYDFPSGANQAVTPTGTVTMADTGVSQDGCQGATLTLHFTSN